MENGDNMISAAKALEMAQAATARAVEQEVPKAMKQIMDLIAKSAAQGRTGIYYDFVLGNALPGLDAGELIETVIKNLRQQGYNAYLLASNRIIIEWKPPS